MSSISGSLASNTLANQNTPLYGAGNSSFNNLTVTGTLNVAGATTLASTLNVGAAQNNSSTITAVGAITGGSLVTAGVVNAGSITTTGAVNCASVTATGAVNAVALTATGLTTAGAGLNVTGATALGGSLGVTGASTLASVSATSLLVPPQTGMGTVAAPLVFNLTPVTNPTGNITLVGNKTVFTINNSLPLAGSTEVIITNPDIAAGNLVPVMYLLTNNGITYTPYTQAIAKLNGAFYFGGGGATQTYLVAWV